MEYPTDKIVFFEGPHTYWLGAQKLNSISSWKKDFWPEYDREFWLTYKVLEAEFGLEFNEHYSSLPGMKPAWNKLFIPFLDRLDPHIFEMMKNTLAEEWERKSAEALFRGSRFHKEFEDRSFANGFIINPWDKRKYEVTQYPKFYDNESLFLNLWDLPDGGYPELLIHSLDLGLCGQSDEVYIQTVGKKRYVDINDFKTGEKPPKKSSPEYCYKPFDSFQSSGHFGYVLQVNMYAYMLSLYGFTVRNMAYTYYKDYDLSKGVKTDVENIQKLIKSTF